MDETTILVSISSRKRNETEERPNNNFSRREKIIAPLSPKSSAGRTGGWTYGATHGLPGGITGPLTKSNSHVIEQMVEQHIFFFYFLICFSFD